MYKQKTTENDKDVHAFIETIQQPQKRQDAYTLLDLFSATTGYEPKMWGPSVIGFGSYHYRYASGHEGDAPLVGFSPRKRAISIYTAVGSDETDKLRTHLGKHKMGKACLYVNKLSDIDLEVLKKILVSSVEFLESTYGRS